MVRLTILPKIDPAGNLQCRSWIFLQGLGTSSCWTCQPPVTSSLDYDDLEIMQDMACFEQYFQLTRSLEMNWKKVTFGIAHYRLETVQTKWEMGTGENQIDFIGKPNL